MERFVLGGAVTGVRNVDAKASKNCDGSWQFRNLSKISNDTFLTQVTAIPNIAVVTVFCPKKIPQINS